MSLSERLGYLRLLRVGFAAILLAVASFAPAARGESLGAVGAASALYLLIAAAPDVTARLRRRHLVPVIGATLLIDGVFLAWGTYATGGIQSPLRFLVYLHVVAVTLLGSYRTGIKIAAWHSLLMLTALYAQSGGLLVPRETLVSALPGHPDFLLVSILSVGALWVITLATATFSAVNERELRTQKIDLEQLSTLVSDLDRRGDAGEIPDILLGRLCEVFEFTRGAVLARRAGDQELAVMASRGAVSGDALTPGVDPVVERSWAARETQLVRALDPGVDSRLAGLIPGGRNLLVVPLVVDRGAQLGVAVLERAGRSDTIKRWVVTIVEQFVAHAALALQNAWLVAEIQEKLDENRALQAELEGQNLALEVKVTERTAELVDSLEELRAVDAQRRNLLSRLVTAEEEERRRIAGDVHDGPIQHLVVASMHLQTLRKRLPELDRAEAAGETIDEVVEALTGSIGGMRDLIFELRPLSIDQDGLVPALQQLARHLVPDVQRSIDDRLATEPPGETRIILYRIAQEALVNMRKHAHATCVEISLEERDGGYVVRIRDDGVGFSPPATLQSSPGHLGLSSMRERAEMARGTCRVTSAPGEGTEIEVWLPGDAVGATPSAMTDVEGTLSRERDGRPALRLVAGDA